jgi:hypothetical protein
VLPNRIIISVVNAVKAEMRSLSRHLVISVRDVRAIYIPNTVKIIRRDYSDIGLIIGLRRIRRNVGKV